MNDQSQSKAEINQAYGRAVQAEQDGRPLDPAAYKSYTGGRFEVKKQSRWVVLWFVLNERRISWFDVLLFAVITSIPGILMALVDW